MKPGQITTVSVNLGTIVAPVPIACLPDAGATLMVVGNGSEKAPGFMVKKWAQGKEGNNNSRRKRRLRRYRSDWGGRE